MFEMLIEDSVMIKVPLPCRFNYVIENIKMGNVWEDLWQKAMLLRC